MTTGDHPDIPFIQASGYTQGRPDGPPIWVVVHDMEYPERDTAAEWNASYFATGAGGRFVSSHYVADSSSVIQCVRLCDTAWTVGNRPGNYRGINWELAGYAAQTRAQWLDDYSRSMLTRAAEIMRRDMEEYHIPAQQLTDQQIRDQVPGVTSHGQLDRIYGGTGHTDPGPNFPWDFLMALLKGDLSMLLIRVKATGAIYATAGTTYWHLTPATYPVALAAYRKTTWDYEVATEADMAAFGVDVTTLQGNGGSGGGPLSINLVGSAVPA